MTLSAPTSATPAYTTLLIKRVVGFVSEEKKMARRDFFSSTSLVLSKASTASSSIPKMESSFSELIISSMSAVCAARAADCSLNIW